VLCGVGIVGAAHTFFADPRNILVTAGSLVASFLLLEVGARLFLGTPPAFPSDGPSFFLSSMLRTAAPDAAVFHAGGMPYSLARAALRVDLGQPPEFLQPSERPPAAMLTTELVCSIVYGSAYKGFVDVSRAPLVLFPQRYTPRAGAARRV